MGVSATEPRIWLGPREKTARTLAQFQRSCSYCLRSMSVTDPDDTS